MGHSDSPPESILIVKLSAIGDVVQTLPVAEALRKHFPRARIDWLVEEEASDLLTGHPALNRVLISRRKSWVKRLWSKGEVRSTLAEIRDFIRQLRDLRYDWVIDNHGILKSGLLVVLSRGRRKIGFKPAAGIAEEGNYLFTNERYAPLDIERHALERYLDLIAQVGIPVGPPVLRFPVPEEALRNAEELLRNRPFSSRPRATIHPLAKWPTKQWPIENFAAVADALLGRGVSVVLTGSPEDEKASEILLSRMAGREKVLNLVGRTGLRELAGIFLHSDLVLTPDTGPMHLAAAVEAPLVALFGPTAPWRTGPYSNGHVVLRKPLACSPCFKKKCPTIECMTSLTVGEVTEAALKRMRISPPPHPSPSRGAGAGGSDCGSKPQTGRGLNPQSETGIKGG